MSDPTPTPPEPVASAPIVAQPKLPNGIGLAGMIVAIVAFIFAIIPVISFIAWLPALVALILSIVGLARKGRKKGTAIVGLILSIVAGIIALIVSIATVVGAASSVHDQDVKEANKAVTIEYKVVSSGHSSKADVTYDTFTTAGKDASVDDDSAKLPFDKTVTVKKGGIFDFNTFSIVAEGSEKKQTITCTILIDGKVADTAKATGSFALATCEADSSDLDK